MAFNVPNQFGEGTDEEMLALVRGRIAAIIAFCQSNANKGREIEYAKLNDLRDYERELLARINTAAGVSQTNYARRMGPA